MSFLYCHFRKDNDEPFYVGIGSKKTRPFEMGSRRSEWHQRITNKYGVRVSTIKKDIDWQIACWWEKRWIKALKSADYELVNFTEGGDGVVGASEETLIKMKEASKKRWSNNENRAAHSIATRAGMDKPEVKEKVAVMRGKKHSQSTKDLMSHTHTIRGKDINLRLLRSKNALGEKNPFFGKKHSEESHIKMSNSLKGRKSPNKGKKFTEEHKQKLRDAWVIRRLKLKGADQ
jgi:hypothetical protein